MEKKQVFCPVCGGHGYTVKTISTDDSIGSIGVWCSHCGGTGRREVPMTNADRIRAMSDEELARFLDDNHNSHGCVCPARDCRPTCRQCIEEWLQQPAEEVDHD